MTTQCRVARWAVWGIALAVLIPLVVFAFAFLLIKSRPDIEIDRAVSRRDVERVKNYIAKGSDVGIHIHSGYSNGGYTPLHVACELGFPEIVQILIDAGANVNDIDDRGQTALMWLVLAHHAPGHTQCARLLIRAGADVNRQNYDGETALHFAVNFKNFGIAEMLLNAGADPNQRDNLGSTPLHAASDQFPRDDDVEGIQLLLKAGADPTLTDSNGKTPFHIAVREKCPKIAEVLSNATAKQEVDPK